MTPLFTQLAESSCARITVIANPKSSSVPNDFAEQLANVFPLPCHTIAVEPVTLIDALRRAVAEAPDLLIAWGGDGTVAAALELAGVDGPPVLALPGGTMNLLHKRIHGEDLTWQDCLSRVVQSGSLSSLPAGQINGRLFFYAALIGKITQMAHPRETLRSGHPVEAAISLVQSDVFNMESRLSVRLGEDASKPERRRTAAAFFPGYSSETSMEVALIDPEGPLDLAWSGINALFGDALDAPGIERRNAIRSTVEDVHGEAMDAILDGEPIELPKSAEITFVENAAKVIRAG